MENMQKEEQDIVDLGIYSESPSSLDLHRISKFISIVILAIISLLFGNEKLRKIWGIIIVVFYSIIVSGGLRFHSDNTFYSVAIIIILFVFLCIIGFLMQKNLHRIMRLIFGPPIFGKLGGIPRKMFFTAMRCSNAIEYEFVDKDSKNMKEFNKLDIDITEETLKKQHRENVFKASGPTDSSDFENKWSKVWKEQILEIKTVEGISFRDSLSEEKFSSRVVIFRLIQSVQILPPLIWVCQLIMLWLISQGLSQSIAVVTIIQVGVFLCFMISIIWLIFTTFHMDKITLMVEPSLPKEIKELYSDRLKKIIGKRVKPKKIIIKKPYYSLMRNFHARLFFFSGSFIDSLILLMLVGISLFIGALWSHTNINMGEIIYWYKYFALSVILLPFAIITGFYLTSIIIQRFKLILAPIILGLLTAALPFAINYLLIGDFEFVELKNSVLTFIAGMGVFLTAIVVSQLSKVFEQKTEPEKN